MRTTAGRLAYRPVLAGANDRKAHNAPASSPRLAAAGPPRLVDSIPNFPRVSRLAGSYHPRRQPVSRPTAAGPEDIHPAIPDNPHDARGAPNNPYPCNPCQQSVSTIRVVLDAGSGGDGLGGSFPDPPRNRRPYTHSPPREL